jgi:hypothetical protein
MGSELYERDWDGGFLPTKSGFAIDGAHWAGIDWLIWGFILIGNSDRVLRKSRGSLCVVGLIALGGRLAPASSPPFSVSCFRWAFKGGWLRIWVFRDLHEEWVTF